MVLCVNDASMHSFCDLSVTFDVVAMVTQDCGYKSYTMPHNIPKVPREGYKAKSKTPNMLPKCTMFMPVTC